jgi:hypothetical protein
MNELDLEIIKQQKEIVKKSNKLNNLIFNKGSEEESVSRLVSDLNKDDNKLQLNINKLKKLANDLNSKFPSNKLPSVSSQEHLYSDFASELIKKYK